MTKSKDELILFLHIPKAAGSTFKKILNRNYSRNSIIQFTGKKSEIENFLLLPEQRKKAINVIEGHMTYGFHKFIPKPYKYLTFLRDPVERVVSLYYFIKRRPAHYLHNKIINDNMSLLDFINSNLSVEIDNHQTRLISGIEDIPIGSCSIEIFEKAKSNLINDFVFVGISEKFNESLLVFKDIFKQNNIFYSVRNQTKNRPLVKNIPDSVINAIAEKNKFDIELYRLAKQMMEKKILSNNNFEIRLKNFEKKNKYLSYYYNIYYYLRNTAKKIIK